MGVGDAVQCGCALCGLNAEKPAVLIVAIGGYGAVGQVAGGPPVAGIVAESELPQVGGDLTGQVIVVVIVGHTGRR